MLCYDSLESELGAQSAWSPPQLIGVAVTAPAPLFRRRWLYDMAGYSNFKQRFWARSISWDNFLV